MAFAVTGAAGREGVVGVAVLPDDVEQPASVMITSTTAADFEHHGASDRVVVGGEGPRFSSPLGSRCRRPAAPGSLHANGHEPRGPTIAAWWSARLVTAACCD